MVYQHELNEMLYKYFNETNLTMREFAEENTQLIAALSQEQDKNKLLKEENKQLIYTLSQELDTNNLLNLVNDYSHDKKDSDYWKQKYHDLETQFQERLDKECKAKQLLLEKQFKEKLNTIKNNHKEETDNLIHSYDMDMADLQEAYEAVCFKNEQLKSHEHSPTYKELNGYYTSLIKDYATLQKDINERDTQIELLNKKRDNLKLTHTNKYNELKEAHANILEDKTRLQKAVRERNSKIDILEDKLRLMKAVSEQNSEIAQKDSTTIELTKKQRDDLQKKYSDLYYHTHNFVESISLEFSLDKTYQTEWNERYINKDFLKTFMEHCTSTINNHQNTIHILEEQRDTYKTDFHLFLTDVIERLTSPTDALRKLTFESRNKVLEACKTCSDLLNVWDSTTIELTKKQRDDLQKKYSDLYYHTHNFVESISLEFSLDKTYQTEWSDRYINNDFLKTFMDYCTSAINNHQNTIHILEEERDVYKTDFHLFLTDVIERLTSPTDALRQVTFESRDDVLETCKTCSGLLNLWDYQRVQTHSSDEIHLDCLSEISEHSETPSQTTETDYTNHLDSMLTEDQPLLDNRDIAEPTGEWVIPDC